MHLLMLLCFRLFCTASRTDDGLRFNADRLKCQESSVVVRISRGSHLTARTVRTVLRARVTQITRSAFRVYYMHMEHGTCVEMFGLAVSSWNTRKRTDSHANARACIHTLIYTDGLMNRTSTREHVLKKCLQCSAISNITRISNVVCFNFSWQHL